MINTDSVQIWVLVSVTGYWAILIPYWRRYITKKEYFRLQTIFAAVATIGYSILFAYKGHWWYAGLAGIWTSDKRKKLVGKVKALFRKFTPSILKPAQNPN